MNLCLITGITGFLGSRIACKLTAEGTKVIGLKRRTSSLDQLDFVNLTGKLELHDVEKDCLNLGRILNGRRVDSIFHTAAHTSFIKTEAEAIDLLDSNVRFPTELLTQAKQSGLVKSFINAGTSWQSPDGDNYAPLNFYAATKEAFEKTLDLAANDAFSCVSLRLFETYGQGDKRNKILDLLVRSTLEGKEINLSPGEQKLFFVHIDDAARAFTMAAHVALTGGIVGHHVYALEGQKPPLRLRDIAALIENITGLAVRANWGKHPYHPNQIMDPKAAQSAVPGWIPEISLEDGIKDLIRSHQKRLLEVAA